MADQSPNPDFAQALQRFRGEIDGIDDKIINLLKDRMAVVEKVGQLKAVHAPGQCPLRPGREAEQVRRVVRAFKHTPFPPAAAAAVWRLLIMAALSVEGDLKISVFAPPGGNYFGLAREYFGPFSTIIRQPTPKRVMGDLIDGKAQIGVLPAFTDQSQGRWWTDIPGTGATKPKIFALLPFVHTAKPTPDTPNAVVMGLIAPEDSGEDLSYLLIEVDEMVSHSKLQAAFAFAKLDARWIEVLSQVPGKRHHLIEVKGFITPEHERYKAFLTGLNGAVIATSFLGAAAAPILLAPQPASAHAQPANA